MSNVIAFLETLGRCAAPETPRGESFVAAVDALGLDDAPRTALLAGDAGALGDLLGGRLQMMCLLFPADGDEQKEDTPADDDGQEEKKEEAGLH